MHQSNKAQFNLSFFESSKIWAAGLVVGELCDSPSHWRQTQSLSQWMRDQNIPGICDIDTRSLTKIIREKGTILGRITKELPRIASPVIPPIEDPNSRNLVAEVSRVI